LTIDLSVSVGGDESFERQLVRRTIRPGVRRVEVREDGLVGTVFLPEGASGLPGVLVLGGSGGGLWEQPAALLASEGYAALALAYFGMDGLPETLSGIPLEYFESGIAHLQDLPEVDEGRIAVMGVSRGGELALLLGATYPQIKGVLAYVPSGLVWSALPGDGPAWTLGGRPVPYVTAKPAPELQRRFREALDAGEPASWTPVARSMMEKELQGGSDAVIAVERINGSILMVSGAEDGLWPSGPLAEVARQRLEEHDFRFPYEHVSYPGAGHVFPPPYLPAMFSQNPGGFVLGGSPEGTARAQEDCWRRTLEFLGETFERNPPDGS
jgi:dienelactone hydrolase